MARPGLTGHRKFRRLARSLGSPITARGVLELIWDSCYESGDEYVGTTEDIETMVGWTGEPGVLARALVDAGAPEGFGFLEPLEGSDDRARRYRVHDLWHHAPDYVSKRRKRELDRLGKVDPSTERRRSEPSSDCQDGDGRPPSPSPSHSPSPSPGEKSGSPLLVFPTVGQGGSEWALTSDRVADWRESFQGLNVLAEAQKALAWVKASPGRRKTAGGMPRFLVGWFSRAVNRGGVVSLEPGSQERTFRPCDHTPKCNSPQWCMVVRSREPS